MKKPTGAAVIKSFSVIICILIHLVGCGSEYTGEKYKRISLSSETLGDSNTVLEQNVSLFADVEYNAKETFSETMPVYRITPRILSDEELVELGKAFSTDGKTESLQQENLAYVASDNSMRINRIDNRVSFLFYNQKSEPMTQNDEEVIAQAKEVFKKIMILEGEYECLGVVSEQIAIGANDVEEIVTKRVSFRRLIDGTRIIGNDVCDLYLCSSGISGIELQLYEYNADGEMEMMSLDEAKDKINDPDAFSITPTETKLVLTGKADTLRVERVKLLYVNQFSDGCTILQPVYNFMGTAISEHDSIGFSSRVIAIPEKYTYTE